MRQIKSTTELEQSSEGLDVFSLAKKVVNTGELQIAAMLLRGGFHCEVKRISRRGEPCSPDVAALPYHYVAEFSRGQDRLTVELSSAESSKVPYPQTFLVQACLSRMLVRSSADFADWRSTMGWGGLANDISIYASACRQAQVMAALFSVEQLQILEKITLEELDGDPVELGYR